MSYHPPKPDADGHPSRPPPPSAEASPALASAGTVADEAGPSPEDMRFINEMAAVGLLAELDGAELLRVLRETDSPSDSTRYLDLMFNYYGGAGDLLCARRRRAADRFFLLTDRDGLTAKLIVEALAGLCPDLGDVNLERIGSDDGPLVLRSGNHVAPVIDEYDEGLDTDEVDLRILDEKPSVTLQSIVQAINTMLHRVGDERRFVPVLSDVGREAYVAVGIDGAIDLCRAGYLELDNSDDLFEHCVFNKR